MPQKLFKSPRAWFSSLVKGTKMEPRGIRNRNPGNIRKSETAWRGLAPVQSDPDFCVFLTMQMGVRATAINILHYVNLHGLKTVRQIITRWAPPSENDTAAYIANVSRIMGVDPDHELRLMGDAVELEELCAAIFRHENGEDIEPLDLLEGCLMAMQAV